MFKCGAYLAVMALLMAACASAQTLPGGRFPLMAWDFANNPKLLQSMHDSGINSVAFVRPDMLDACQNFDLQCIVFDERLAGDDWSKPFDGDRFARNLPAVLQETKDKPAVYGYHIKDEPAAKEFPELAKAVAAVKKLAAGKWPYINLLPGTSKEHEKYVADFISICSPTALSYDRYSIVGDAGSGDLDPDFWTNLEQFRELAVKNHLPLWNIVLSSPHWRYRELTEDDLRLEIWGSLVYGAKGIAFYKFISRELPILHVPDLGNFRDGPLDQFYERTPAWYWLRNMARQVQSIGSILLKLQSDDTYHIGDVPRANHGPNNQSLVQDLQGGEFVAGDFTGQNGHRYAIVVNKNLKRSVPLHPTFRPDIKTAHVVSSITGEIRPLTQYFWLAPGQGVLLQLQ